MVLNYQLIMCAFLCVCFSAKNTETKMSALSGKFAQNFEQKEMKTDTACDLMILQ